jgi:hypothetical protein
MVINQNSEGTPMKVTFKFIIAIVAAGALEALFAGHASAGCDLRNQESAPVPRQQQPAAGQAQFIRTAFVQVWDQYDAPIVGLWKFGFTAKGNTNGIPDGTPIDQGYVQWHGDGTELMNSFRAPTTGQFCMGVWKQVAHSTYVLNHFALGWNFDAGAPVTGPGTGGATFAGTTNIREEVWLDSAGNSYMGTFTLTSYTPEGTMVVPPTPIKGVVKGTRVTADSTEDDAGITDP